LSAVDANVSYPSWLLPLLPDGLSSQGNEDVVVGDVNP
jgi:hypothetical protein